MNCLKPIVNLWELVTENQLAFLGFSFSFCSWSYSKMCKGKERKQVGQG